MERKRIFVDGMESVSLTDGMIRMELYNVLLNPSHNPQAPNAHEVTGELIMTPQGFVKAFWSANWNRRESFSATTKNPETPGSRTIPFPRTSSNRSHFPYGIHQSCQISIKKP